MDIIVSCISFEGDPLPDYTLGEHKKKMPNDENVYVDILFQVLNYLPNLYKLYVHISLPSFASTFLALPSSLPPILHFYPFPMHTNDQGLCVCMHLVRANTFLIKVG